MCGGFDPSAQRSKWRSSRHGYPAPGSKQQTCGNAACKAQSTGLEPTSRAAQPAADAPLASSELVDRVAQVLVLAIRTANERVALSANDCRRPSPFDSAEVPGITVEKYLHRLRVIARCGDAIFVAALILLDRFVEKMAASAQAQPLTMSNVHRLFLTCLVVAVKYNEDAVYGNVHYAKAGGVHVREVSRLERSLVQALDWDLRVTTEQYDIYQQALFALDPVSGPSPGRPEESMAKPPVVAGISAA